MFSYEMLKIKNREDNGKKTEEGNYGEKIEKKLRKHFFLHLREICEP